MPPSASVAGVTLTNPDRVLFDAQGITKRMLAEYYVRIAPRMLPHVIDRPLSIVRCPQGQGGPCFYQKHWTTALPPGVCTVDIQEEEGDRKPYLYIQDVQGLVSLVQFGVLEFHLWGARVGHVESPDRIIFDLDPAPDVPWARVANTALRLRALLKACGLASWLKTTGGKGLHVLVPIVPDVTWYDVHDFVRLATARMVADDPDGLVDVASKAARTDRIFVDYLRNSRGATAVAPWSCRSRPGAPVAVPVSWRTLKTLSAGDGVHVNEVSRYLSRARADPWRRVISDRQRLTEAVMELLMTA